MNLEEVRKEFQKGIKAAQQAGAKLSHKEVLSQARKNSSNPHQDSSKVLVQKSAM